MSINSTFPPSPPSGPLCFPTPFLPSFFICVSVSPPLSSISPLAPLAPSLFLSTLADTPPSLSPLVLLSVSHLPLFPPVCIVCNSPPLPPISPLANLSPSLFLSTLAVTPLSLSRLTLSQCISSPTLPSCLHCLLLAPFFLPFCQSLPLSVPIYRGCGNSSFHLLYPLANLSPSLFLSTVVVVTPPSIFSILSPISPPLCSYLPWLW